MKTETLQEKNEVQSLGNIYNEPYDISESFGRIDDNNNNNTPDDESKILKITSRSKTPGESNGRICRL